MASLTESRVSFRTRKDGSLLMLRDAAPIETPARLATSVVVILFGLVGGHHAILGDQTLGVRAERPMR